ncbi:MAG: CBS domain-containing protein [Coriobacteriales bacterium]|nr:CBS domain-containing protein [Coriobacteriales bacterium]
MIYLSQLLGKPVVDASGSEIGTINDIAIVTGEVFPRVTSLAFLGPDKTPFMLSWRKYVEQFDGERVQLNQDQPSIRFSYLQPDEVLLARDLLNKQIVDTQGKKVVRVNDLKLSESRNQLRLLGAEVGLRGLLRALSPGIERSLSALLRGRLHENLIAWNYMDLLDRDLSQVKLSITHKRLHELHPADVADILEQLSPSQRAAFFTQLDNEAAAETISELEDEYQADVIDDLSERRASLLLAEMDPDDAADIIADLPYDKAERLLRLMGLEDAGAIRYLLGYKEKSAGGIMTPEVTTVTDEMTVSEVIEKLRSESEESATIYYIYVVNEDRRLKGVVSLRDLLLASPDTTVAEIAERDLITANVDDDQEDVAEAMSKYDLLAMPVIDENNLLLGIVTVDDALEVLEEEADEDLALATGSERAGMAAMTWWWYVRRSIWIVVWAIAGSLGLWLASDVLVDPRFAVVDVLLLGSVIILPVLLRTAEEVSQRAIADLIEEPDPERRPSVWRQLAGNGIVGAALGTVAGGAAFALAGVAGIQTEAAVPFGVVVGLAILCILVAGVAVSRYARRLADQDKRISGTTLSLAMMIAATLIYAALALVVGIASVQLLPTVTGVLIQSFGG